MENIRRREVNEKLQNIFKLIHKIFVQLINLIHDVPKSPLIIIYF